MRELKGLKDIIMENLYISIIKGVIMLERQAKDDGFVLSTGYILSVIDKVFG